MRRNNMRRTNLTWGIILLGLGAAFLLNQFFPALFNWFSWPWIMIVIGILFATAALINRVGGLMVPGVILIGVGGIFLYQVQTDNPSMWSYAWGLMLAFAGLGIIIGGLIDYHMRPARRYGAVMVVAGLVFFAIFGAFDIDPGILRFWPVLLILFGLWVLYQAARSRE